MPNPVKDLTGQKFGRLTVIRQEGVNQSGSALWFCECRCGYVRTVSSSNLRSGNTRSCGCLREDNRKIAQLKSRDRWFGQLVPREQR